ncbi:MAG: cytidylate kinase-like family protein [Rhodospirillales bacterium]|nr:MAG: cytidylate kinase-like family protein [Rhodospirillales bacterium]
MAVDAQAVINAMIRAMEAPPQEALREVKPVITVSRTLGSGGDTIARALAERLGLACYDREILDGIAAEANVSKSLIERLTEKMDAVDSWVYSVVFGKHVSRDEYARFLTTIVRGLYHTGGVICGRAGHVILAGRDILRVRVVGSVEACASRLSEERGISYSEAKQTVVDTNKRRERFMWEVFRSRYDDPISFDLTINTDNFRKSDDVVEVILSAIKGRGLDKPRRAPTPPPGTVRAT